MEENARWKIEKWDEEYSRVVVQNMLLTNTFLIDASNLKTEEET